MIAAPIDQDSAPEGMFVSSKSPTRSIRTAPHGAGLLLLVGGEWPCHGSRFGIDGRVVQGPAVEDLRRLDPEALR